MLLITTSVQKNIIIAIDGHSSTGKSTLAKMLSKHYNFVHINTGSMYRAVTLNAIRKNIINLNDSPEKINEDVLNKSVDSNIGVIISSKL